MLKEILHRRDDIPHGKTWEEWTAEWWQWILSIPKTHNPIYDLNGEKSCYNRNDENVVFLAGTPGGRAERRVTIPQHKSIFLPVINCTTSYAENPSLKTEAEMFAFVQSNIDDIRHKSASIYGLDIVNLENYRVRSGVFKVTFPENNIFDAEPGETIAVSDGYWLFMKPFGIGSHNIRTFGSCLSGRITIDVAYDIIVKE
jgi:hypothetical protein